MEEGWGGTLFIIDVCQTQKGIWLEGSRNWAETNLAPAQKAGKKLVAIEVVKERGDEGSDPALHVPPISSRLFLPPSSVE